MKDKSRKAALIAFFAFLISCSSSKQPVDIFPEDICRFCKMAISQKQFAAEMITETDEVYKFDDIGCMLTFISTHKLKSKVVASYVMDFDELDWIPAETANFIATNKIETPMNGGLIAFGANPDSALKQYGGRLFTYSQLVQEKKP